MGDKLVRRLPGLFKIYLHFGQGKFLAEEIFQ